MTTLLYLLTLILPMLESKVYFCESNGKDGELSNTNTYILTVR